jgi:hypothetical protein
MPDLPRSCPSEPCHGRLRGLGDRSHGRRVVLRLLCHQRLPARCLPAQYRLSPPGQTAG